MNSIWDCILHIGLIVNKAESFILFPVLSYHKFCKLTLTEVCLMFRQKVCCGIVYKGRYGEVIIDPHLYKPCCQRKPKLLQQEGEGGPMDEEEEEQATGKNTVSIPKQEEEVEEKEQLVKEHDDGSSRLVSSSSMDRLTDADMWHSSKHTGTQMVQTKPPCSFSICYKLLQPCQTYLWYHLDWILGLVLFSVSWLAMRFCLFVNTLLCSVSEMLDQWMLHGNLKTSGVHPLLLG